MLRDYKAYLKDILEAIDRIESYITNLTFDDFSESRLYQDAIVRNLEIIGEAVKRLPEKIIDKYPEIEWKKIAGLRDILIHAYFGIDTEIVWDVTVTNPETPWVVVVFPDGDLTWKHELTGTLNDKQ